MIINFRKVIEAIFKSFDVAWDTKLIEKLEKDWIRFLIVLKRHWVYALFASWRVLGVFLLWVVNVYLLLIANSSHDIYSTIIGFLLIVNVLYWLYVVIVYLKNFYKIQWSKPYIEDIYSAIKKSKDSDEVFSNFFNQTIFVLIFLIIIVIFSITTATTAALTNFDEQVWLWFFNAILLIIQFGLFLWFLWKMINLEMDYQLIIPWKIFFADQAWLYWSSKTMNSQKIKTINTKYSGILNSLFNYWNIVVLSEWDKENNWEMSMDYVWNPVKTVEEINKVVNNNLAAIEKDVNVFLSKMKHEIWIENVDNEENILKLKEYVSNNENKLKEMFEVWDDELKNEIRELFIILSK